MKRFAAVLLFVSATPAMSQTSMTAAANPAVSTTRMLWDQMTALGVVTVLPVLLFALAVQRYLVRGLTLGAVKE